MKLRKNTACFRPLVAVLLALAAPCLGPLQARPNAAVAAFRKLHGLPEVGLILRKKLEPNVCGDDEECRLTVFASAPAGEPITGGGTWSFVKAGATLGQGNPLSRGVSFSDFDLQGRELRFSYNGPMNDAAAKLAWDVKNGSYATASEPGVWITFGEGAPFSQEVKVRVLECEYLQTGELGSLDYVPVTFAATFELGEPGSDKRVRGIVRYSRRPRARYARP